MYMDIIIEFVKLQDVFVGIKMIRRQLVLVISRFVSYHYYAGVMLNANLHFGSTCLFKINYRLS